MNNFPVELSLDLVKGEKPDYDFSQIMPFFRHEQFQDWLQVEMQTALQVVNVAIDAACVDVGETRQDKQSLLGFLLAEVRRLEFVKLVNLQLKYNEFIQQEAQRSQARQDELDHTCSSLTELIRSLR